MTKIVISGSADCPRYAAVEFVADTLANNLSEFKVMKIVTSPNEWEDYSKKLASIYNWPVLPSPIIWRELVDRGGICTLIGSANDFLEYAKTYYNIECTLTSEIRLGIALENAATKEANSLLANKAIASYIPFEKITIIGADSPSSTNLLLYFATEPIFNDTQGIDIILYSNSELCNDILTDLKETVESCGSPYIHAISIAFDLDSAIKDSSQIIILDILPRLQLEDGTFEPRDSWLTRRFLFLKKIGQSIMKHCSYTTRVLVAGCLSLFKASTMFATPVNFDVMSLYSITSGLLPASNFVGLVRPLEGRIKAAIGQQMMLRSCDLTDLILWGNIDKCFHIDVSCMRAYRRADAEDSITGPSWFSLEAEPYIWNKQWLQEEIQNTALVTMAFESRYRGAICHSSACACFLKKWWIGSNQTEENICSLVIISDGSYEVPKGIAFSFPVTLRPPGTISIVQDVLINETKKEKINECIKDVLNDWAIIDSKPLNCFIEKSKKINNQSAEESHEPLDSDQHLNNEI